MSGLEAWILSVLLGVLPPKELQVPNGKETIEETQERYAEIAIDMAAVITTSEPLFRGRDGVVKTAAVMIATARHESTLRADVDFGETRGDGGRSWCLMQINIGKKTVRVGPEYMRTWHGEDLVSDRRKCFQAGLEHLRASMQQCRQYRNSATSISGYIHGPRCVLDDKRSQVRWDLATRILKSRKRWELAQGILKQYPPLPNDPPQSVALGG